MTDTNIKYPRNWLVRAFLRVLGRIILPVFFRIKIEGKENFPKTGPVILIGNHNAAMEAVLMVIYSPWQVELIGTGDIPQEKLTEFVEAIYKYIPVRRGHVDRPALQAALGILEQGGVLGIFPEGGIWHPGQMKAQTGVAWLSYRSKAPVVPMGFGGTMGSLNDAFKLKRPQLTVNIGELIPAARKPVGQARKTYFEEYSEQAMQRVRELLPPDDPALEIKLQDERFEFEISATDSAGNPIDLPTDLQVKEGISLAKFLHRPMILKIFAVNFGLSIQALQRLDLSPTPAEIAQAAQLILNQIDAEYTYLLTYRFGPKEAEEIQTGLNRLCQIALWADKYQYHLSVVPTRKYFSVPENKEITQTVQEVAGTWM